MFTYTTHCLPTHLSSAPDTLRPSCYHPALFLLHWCTNHAATPHHAVGTCGCCNSVSLWCNSVSLCFNITQRHCHVHTTTTNNTHKRSSHNTPPLQITHTSSVYYPPPPPHHLAMHVLHLFIIQFTILHHKITHGQRCRAHRDPRCHPCRWAPFSGLGDWLPHHRRPLIVRGALMVVGRGCREQGRGWEEGAAWGGATHGSDGGLGVCVGGHEHVEVSTKHTSGGGGGRRGGGGGAGFCLLVVPALCIVWWCVLGCGLR